MEKEPNVGCLRQLFVQIGCLVVLLALVVLGFLFKDQLGAVYRRVRHLPPPAEEAHYVPPAPAPGGLEGARQALARLQQRGGPAWVDLSAAQVGALIEERLKSTGRRSAVDSLAVAFVGDEARVRGVVDLSGVPRGALGPFVGALDRRQPVALGGIFSADSAGRVWWTVTRLVVGDFPFPRGTIGAVLRQLQVPELRGSAIPLPLREPVGDATVRNDALRLYRYGR